MQWNGGHPVAWFDLAHLPGLIVAGLAAIAIIRYGEDIAWALRRRWTLERPTRRPWTWTVRRRWYAPGSIVVIADGGHRAHVVGWRPLDRKPHAVVQVHPITAAGDETDCCRWLPLTSLTPAAR